ncbi:MAG: PilT/PilU family type 4a pilus ATPase [Parcubacteria group bacterium]|nr:PilT/PilU family type 4a pilus ATPase [Parcubacteria group bacterium]
MDDYKKELEELLLTVAKEQASDLHLSVGRHPTLRIAGVLTPLAKKPVLTPADTEGLVMAMLSTESQKKFRVQHEVDFSYTFADQARFRVNIFYQRGFVGAALRLIPARIKNLQELLLPDVLADFARREQGFFLVVGPTGHGKSTSLAAMVDIINHERAEHIITIEDPIEYFFVQDKSIIDQRAVGFDTADFRTALRSMFREDVNVAMVGEMRDRETVAAAVTAAETGHLVFSSLHTNNAAQTIDRIIDSFSAEQQNQIRLQLANTLLGIFSQRLVPRVSGGLLPAYELLIANTAVRNLIRENKVHEINLVIETSSEEGMISLNQTLVDLVRQGEITMEAATAHSFNPHELQTLLRG